MAHPKAVRLSDRIIEVCGNRRISSTILSGFDKYWVVVDNPGLWRYDIAVRADYVEPINPGHVIAQFGFDSFAIFKRDFAIEEVIHKVLEGVNER